VTTLGCIIGSVAEAVDMFNHTDPAAEPNMINSTAHAARWLAVLGADPAVTMALPAGIVQLVMQNSVLFDEKPANADQWGIPVFSVDQSIVDMTTAMRAFWIEEMEVDAGRFEAFLDMPSNRIEAIVRMVDTPGPYEVVDTIDKARLLSLPLATLNLIGNMYGMYLDADPVAAAVDAVLAEIDAGTLANDHDAIEARLKVILDTDMLVDP
jgi:hypothetical protein